MVNGDLKPLSQEKMGETKNPVTKLSLRIFTSCVLIGITIYILFYTTASYFSLEVLFFIGLALFEFFTLLLQARVPVYRLSGMVIGAGIPVIVYMELGHTQSGEVLFLVLGCLFIFLLQFFRKDHAQSLIAVALTVFGLLYISWFLSFLIKMRFLEGGILWIAYLVTVTKTEDIGAYMIGTLLGKHPLAPHISPKKTVEGTLGGLFFSMIVSVLWYSHLPLRFSFPHLLVLGLLIGVVGQIGDLSESLMKRFCNAKDSGALLPGMGGVLDAVDSILFTAPIFYFHLKLYL